MNGPIGGGDLGAFVERSGNAPVSIQVSITVLAAGRRGDNRSGPRPACFIRHIISSAVGKRACRVKRQNGPTKEARELDGDEAMPELRPEQRQLVGV